MRERADHPEPSVRRKGRDGVCGGLPGVLLLVVFALLLPACGAAPAGGSGDDGSPSPTPVARRSAHLKSRSGRPERILSYLWRPAAPQKVRIVCGDGREVEGPPRRVVFVHGTPGSADAFRGYLRGAEQHRPFELVSIDRPGFGRTQPRRAVPSLAEQARALLAVLPGVSAAPKPILVGHSLGAPIIAKAAAMFARRIGGLVVLAGAFDPGLERVHPLQYLGEAPPFVWLLSRSLRNANRELIPLKRELEVLRAELPRIRQPVIVLHGTRDRLVPFVNTGYLRHFLKNAARLEIRPLEGFDHFIVWSAPSAVWRAIEDMDRWLRCSAVSSR